MSTLAEQAAAAVGLTLPAMPGTAASDRPNPADAHVTSASTSRPTPAYSGSSPVAVVEDFASKLQCARIIAYFEEHIALNPARTGDGFFDGRVLWKTSFPVGSPAYAILQAWQLDAEQVVSSYHGRALWSDNAQVVKWPVGKEMTPHRDDRHPDETKPHNTPYREIAGLVYLNDDYQDGEIHFPDLNAAHKPKAGQFVFFPGLLWHGVRAPVGGPRYTSPQWYTTLAQHRDPTLPSSR